MNFQPRLDLPTDIQRATGKEAPALSRLAIASKASWGYPPGWMATASIYLQISSEYIARNPVYKAISGGEIAGWYSLRLQNGTSWLDNL